MSTSILDVIGHYQRSIERAQKQNNPLAEGKSAKFLHCIEKLNKLPVKVEHLQATGIGKTVNSLRKYEGEVGVAAKSLVAKWKAVVTAEEYANEQATRNIREHRNNDNNDGGRGGSGGGSNGPIGTILTNSDNGYSSEREIAQNYQHSTSNNSGRQQTTKPNSTTGIYNQNRKVDNNNRHNSSSDMHVKMPAPNARPPVSIIDPNYIHTIDDDDDDDNDVQLIIDENTSSHVKASPQLSSSTVVNIKSEKCGNEEKIGTNLINESSKNRDQSTKKDKHQKCTERKHDFENRRNNTSHSSNVKSLESNSVSNHLKHPNDIMLSNHEPPSAAEVCQEDMHSDRIPYDNSISDIVNDKDISSIQNEDNRSSKSHKSSHNESEHSSKKKKSKKHKEKKSKSKHHDGDSSKHSDSKHEKKHKEKDKSSKDKSSKDKKPKEKSDEKPYNTLIEENENGVINIHSSNKDSHHDQKIRHSDEYQNEVSSTTMSPTKVKKPKNEFINDNGIDSTTGASFEQALGMMTLPNKKVKLQKNESSHSDNQQDQISTKKRLSRDEPSGSGIVNKKQKFSVIAEISSNSESESDGETEGITSNTPLLLSSGANLKPLDPNIALELPTISNNYKPMPLNPTVMDCVFPQIKPQRMFTDEEALAHGISSKTIRTKVYSGVKTGQKVQIPSLFDLCIRCLQKNIDALEYTGGVPFDILKAVLERATPEQLLQFEEYNPYLMHDTDILWEQHVKRRFRSYKREEMESFREMYLRCKEMQDAHLNRLTENIKQSQIQTTLPQRKTQLAYVDSFVKPPRYVKKKQERFGTNEKLVATPAARVAALQAITPNATKSGDVRLRVAAGTRDNAQATSTPKARKAPLMAKTLQFMRGRIRR